MFETSEVDDVEDEEEWRRRRDVDFEDMSIIVFLV